ncbi:MAG: hypothetical protein LUD25_05715 [Coriobacteriaceae bacterium]|nr:hypothetical protein [Coriobacteriaceae bacterium]
MRRGIGDRIRRLHRRRGLLRDTGGQATVEYLVVGTVIMIIVVGLAAVWNYASDGSLGTLIDAGASHALSTIGGLSDVMAF